MLDIGDIEQERKPGKSDQNEQKEENARTQNKMEKT